MSTQSNVEVSQLRSIPKVAAASSWNTSTPATNPMTVRLDTTKTGLWMSRPKIRMLS